MSDIYRAMFKLQLDFFEDIDLVYTVGFLQTLALAPIAKVLKVSGKLAKDPLKRDDDTRTILFHIIRRFGSQKLSEEAMAHMNRAHAAYRITNDDYLYVLSVYVTLFVDWCESEFAWKRASPEATEAWRRGWIEIGENMGIKDIPQSVDAFKVIMKDYEASHLRETAETVELGQKYLKMAIGRHPFALRWFYSSYYRTFLSVRYLDTMKIPRPSFVARSLIHGFVKIRNATIPVKRRLILKFWPSRYQLKEIPKLPVSESFSEG